MLKNAAPHNVFAIAAVALFLISFAIPFRSVDIHVHDTYYVLDMSFLLRSTACFLLVLFTVNTWLKQKLYSEVLTRMHAILTILPIPVIIFLMYKAPDSYRPGFSDWSTVHTMHQTFAVSLLVFVAAQVLMIVNLLVGLSSFRKRRGE